MKKQKTQLIVILVVLAVLVASYFALSAHNKKVAEEESTDAYTILTMDTSTVKEVKLTKTTKTEVVADAATEDASVSDTASEGASDETAADASASETATEDASAASEASDSSSAAEEASTEVEYEYSSEVSYDLVLEDGTWYLSSDKSLAIDTDTVTSLLSNLATVTSDKEIAGVTDFAQYGLDHPTLVIEVTTNDGTTTTINIGDYNSVSSLYYARIGDSANVYLIASALYTSFNVDASSFEQVDSSESTTEVSTGISDVDIDATAASSAAAAAASTENSADASADASAKASAETSADATTDASAAN